jgi:hypothetical protein
MTMAEWCASLVETAPHLFEGSAGGRAAGGGGSGSGKKVAAGDNAAFIQNLDGIAKGTVAVQPAG